MGCSRGAGRFARAGVRAGRRVRGGLGRLTAGTDAWLGFAYVALFSMFLGFFAWYRWLPLGGIARIGQIQLAQPVLTLAWALLLGEEVGSPPSRRRSPCSPASGSPSGRG